ncbi:D-TA family PLP-dependent enzyme [Nitratireductor mangrovi]|uniref:D-TA family PLP-dependent enzyme n=2 Tax=Nitratireductor mangrovi TaxID=2599600 RepID=A0A5B8L6I0_9HYPH|nr:D-TA family PLP-dependent enzyme [Nitratireductor mangrovi]
MKPQKSRSSVADLDTPAVTIDLDRVDENIARVQRRIEGCGLVNRPHVKTHKIPAIAQKQIDAGAVGITCQKLGEVEAFVEAGVTGDILVTFNIVGDLKTERLMALVPRVKRLAVVADNEVVLRGLSEAARRHGRDLPVLLECDSGFGRNGLQTPDEALDLAKLAAQLPNLRFDGLLVFPNTAPRTKGFFEAAVSKFEAAGVPLPILSGGGTPALNALEDYPMMTEHRAGTYVYNDVMMVHSGAARWDNCAMTVRTTVVSRPTADRAIVDAGSKVLTREQYYVENFGRVAEYPDAVVANLSEEHGMLDLSACRDKPKVGDVVSIIPNHCCVVSNMVDEVHGVRDGMIEVVWPVAARGKVT